MERNEREQHRDRHRRNRDGRAGEVPQKNQDDDDYCDDDFKDGLLHSTDRVVNQLGSVIDRNDLHSFRKAGLDLFDLGFHPVDDFQRILAVAHDDDTRDDFARTIEFSKAATQVGAHHHLADIFHTDLRTALADAQRDVFKILQRARVTAAANHILRAPKFKQSSTGFVVPSAYRLDYAADRDAIRLQTIRVQVHLELARITTDGRNIGYAWHRAQVITQIPVLIRTQIGETVLARRIHQSVLIDPPESGGVRAKLGLNPIRQSGKDAREILQYSCARPVKIGSVRKDYIDRKSTRLHSS